MGTSLFSFGVITDVQYADVRNGLSYGGNKRYYRDSRIALRKAVDDWRTQDLKFVIHLGDIIDGKAVTHSDQALKDVLDEFDRLETPVYHVIGNHCLYNFPRDELNQRLRIASPTAGASHYAFTPAPGCRVVVLDGYDVSLLGWPEGHPHHQLAKGILDTNNPNEEKNDPDPMVGVARRFVKFGGGISDQQLQWLEQQLQEATVAEQRVIVCCHLPIHPDTANAACLLWNYVEVLDLLEEYSCVAATFSGHAHMDGHAVAKGLHHRVLNCVVETEPGNTCHGVVHVYPDSLQLEGQGDLQSTHMPLRALRPAAKGRPAAAAEHAAADALAGLRLHSGTAQAGQGSVQQCSSSRPAVAVEAGPEDGGLHVTCARTGQVRS